MNHFKQSKTWLRVLNGSVALAFAAFILVNYWPIVKLFDLSRADLQYQGEWTGGHDRLVTDVTPDGVADRAGLKPGDVIEFDPNRNVDWVLAGYRDMPEGFSATLPVRRPDGAQAVVTVTPERVPYLPTLNDRVALLVRLCSLTLVLLFGAFMVWARPSLMTWSLFFALHGGLPVRPWATYFLAFEAGPDSGLMPAVMGMVVNSTAAVVIFALCFPRDNLRHWAWWRQATVLVVVLAVMAKMTTVLNFTPFERDAFSQGTNFIWVAFATAIVFISIAALAHTYRTSDDRERARLKWAVLGMSIAWAGMLLSLTPLLQPPPLSALSGSGITPVHWVLVPSQGILFPLALGYAVLRLRVLDVQFAVSRTVVYGIVTTGVLVFIAVLHWLLGRMIEHSRLAFGLEGLAAVGLGLVLHRASHGINAIVDRVLFRKHHAAEERLRHVARALPFATTEQSIAEAIVVEPTRNLELASAALFYRDSAEGPLRRVLSVGWVEAHVSSLDPEGILLRYLQAEHAALRLEDEQQWLPSGVPEGVAHPVLAIPIVTQHSLNAVVLYGSHVNGTLPDPDEVVLLEALAKAAATSHQQVRIAMLMRENASLKSEKSALVLEKQTQQEMFDQFESKLRALTQEREALKRR